MTVQLDHFMVPGRNKLASARPLAQLLGVPWAETGVGPFAPLGYLIAVVHGPIDNKVDTGHGGSIVYWNEPEGQVGIADAALCAATRRFGAIAPRKRPA